MSNRPIAHIRAVRRRTWAERATALEAWWLLGAARVAVLVVPFRVIAARMGRSRSVAATDLTATERTAATRVEWAVAAAAARTPWTSNCLARAVAATIMLRRRRVPSTLYLGVAKAADPGERLEAHAWVRCGAGIVTGASEAGRFSTLTSFASGPVDSER